jgi:hypothetical protein
MIDERMDRVRVQTEVIEMSTSADRYPSWPYDDFVPTEELARRQGVKPLESPDQVAITPDPFDSDGEYEEFLADLYASRRASIA